jgi:hypothetical protein
MLPPEKAKWPEPTKLVIPAYVFFMMVSTLNQQHGIAAP